jgi:hypothetical protein
MKFLSTLGAAIFFLCCLCSQNCLAAPLETVTIKSISFEHISRSSEQLSILLSGKPVYKIFALEGANPRLVIDIIGSRYTGKPPKLSAQDRLVTDIRTGFHSDPAAKTRIVLDLSGSVPVQYKHDFDERVNLLQVSLTEKNVEGLDPPVPATDPVVATENAAENLPVTSEEQSPAKTGPRALEEQTQQSAPVQQTPSSILLKSISFDDSSSGAEMVEFYLSDRIYPSVNTLIEGSPRIVCEFENTGPGSTLAEEILVKGNYVEGIRTRIGDNPQKITVTIDLVPTRDYNLQQLFFKNENIFVLIFSEVAVKESS